MRQRRGDIVKVHFAAMLEGGSVFARSKEGQPLEFCIGKKTVPLDKEEDERHMREFKRNDREYEFHYAIERHVRIPKRGYIKDKA